MKLKIQIQIKECEVKNQVNISITIQPAAGGGGGSDLVIDASGVPTSGQVGEPFTGEIKVSGGVEPYSFRLAGGALPDGVSLMSDGTLEGTPTNAGTFSPIIEVADAQG